MTHFDFESYLNRRPVSTQSFISKYLWVLEYVNPVTQSTPTSKQC